MRKLLIIALATFMVACTENEPATPEAAKPVTIPVVVASNFPLFYFAREIAGDEIEVRMPAIEGDPAMWAPTGDDALALQQADLLILNGAGYESWLAFTTLSAGNSLDTTAEVRDRLLPIEETTVHQHGPQGEHSHEGTAFTTWLDPQLAIEQARAILAGLSSLRPDQTELFTRNFENLRQRLEELDGSMRRSFDQLGEQAVIFSHPVYQYLQHRYGINGRNLHWEPDVEPGTRDWIELGNLLREHPASLMIWEDAPLDTVREKLMEMGVASAVLSPMANPPGDVEYFATIGEGLRQLAGLAGEPP